MTRSVVVVHHGHCFDGMASAAVLTRLLRAVEPGALEFSYRGLDHQPGGSYVPDAVLSGELNAVVDFRYSCSERLHWYFDHHASGVDDEQRAHLAGDASGRKFFDPDYGSCCKLIADVAATRFGVQLPDLEELVRWADFIDAARYPDARSAVALDAPATRLMTVLEAHGDDAFLAGRIARLAGGTSLGEVASDPEVRRLFEPLYEVHRRTLDATSAGARCDGGVVFCDLVGRGDDRFNKFIPYYLHPDARYAVVVSAGPSRSKVSVGRNPWAPVQASHDIAALCARFGGGGHRAVGAVSLRPEEVERAREIARAIAQELSAPPNG